MSYTAAIFDLDGTLCDTLPDIHKSVNLTLSELGFSERPYSHTALGINHGSRYLIAHALPEGADDKTIDDTLARYMEIYSEHLCDTTVPYPGLFELTSRLRAEGVKLAVLSNKPDALVKRLAGRCFPGVFDSVIGQGKYPVKPSPEAPLAIADEFGISPRDILFIGDSDVDMKTARAAGMTPVGVLWGYRSRDILVGAGAEYTVGEPGEIYDIIFKNKETAK